MSYLEQSTDAGRHLMPDLVRLFALGVALFTLVFSSLWRTKFKRGPMEALLCSFTYLGHR